MLLLKLQFFSPWRTMIPLALGLVALIWVLGVVLGLRRLEPWLAVF